MLASQIASAVNAGDPRLRSTSSLSGDLCSPRRVFVVVRKTRGASIWKTIVFSTQKRIDQQIG